MSDGATPIPDRLGQRKRAILHALAEEDRPITVSEFRERFDIRSGHVVTKRLCDELVMSGEAESVVIVKNGIEYSAYQIKRPKPKPVVAASSSTPVACLPASIESLEPSAPFLSEIRRLIEDIILTQESTRIQIEQLRDILSDYCGQPVSLQQMLERYAISTGQDLSSVVYLELVPLLAGIAGRKSRDPHRFATNGFHH
jgi:hypothetical protein